jgi:hypothetical protein
MVLQKTLAEQALQRKGRRILSETKSSTDYRKFKQRNKLASLQDDDEYSSSICFCSRAPN